MWNPPSGCTKRIMKSPLDEQDLKVNLVLISPGEQRPILKPCLEGMGMAEAVHPLHTGRGRAAFLMAPDGTFLLGERNSEYIAPKHG